ncbi:MAG: flavin reductase [Chloroflexi bacterium]|nr:flavin reductase [Chloroflexota bacterium]MDA1001778.1 flavin reductase [Chloroflexota bacterium]
MVEPRARDPLSYFWSPLCAVGSHGEWPNAQICVSVFGASIVPERPRLLIGLWKENFTHDLVATSGTLAVTLLGQAQSGLIGPLGLGSGRAGNKLAGPDHELTAAGDPYFTGGTGYIDAEVLNAFDWGDATGYLVAVRHRERMSGDEPLTWPDARPLLPASLLQRWDEKSRRDQAAARAVMRWL